MAKNIANINIDILIAQNIDNSAKKGGPLFCLLFLLIFLALFWANVRWFERSNINILNTWYFYVYFYGNF